MNFCQTHEGWALEFSSGRMLVVSCGIVGIDANPDEGESGIFEGYDREIRTQGFDDTEYFGEAGNKGTAWTPEERAELAQHMIGLWKRFGGM